MRFMTLSILLSGCAGMFAEDPTFTTKHGIGVEVPEGDYGDDLSDVEIFNRAFDIVFDIAADKTGMRRSKIVETVVDDGMRLRMCDHVMSRNGNDYILGYYDFADVTISNEYPGQLKFLAHEMAHVLPWLLDGEDTADHPTGKWFNAEGSLEKLGGHQIFRDALIFQGLLPESVR